MAAVREKPVAQGLRGREQKGEQEGIDRGNDEHELESIVPGPEVRTFKSQLGFGVAEGEFNLPATGVGKDDAPGIIGGEDRLVGQEVPGLTPGARTGDDQPERLVMLRMVDLSKDNACALGALAA